MCAGFGLHPRRMLLFLRLVIPPSSSFKGVTPPQAGGRHKLGHGRSRTTEATSSEVLGTAGTSICGASHCLSPEVRRLRGSSSPNPGS